MGFWTNNPKGESEPKKDKRAKGEKTPAPAQGSTWTNGRQGSAHAVTVLIIAVMITGPIGAVLGFTALNRAPVAVAAAKADGLTTVQQSTGSYAVGFVGAWLGASKANPGELGNYVDLNTLRGLSETASEYRDMAVVDVTANDGSNIVTAVVSANVKSLIPDPNKPGAAAEAWPRRYFQVAVVSAESGMRPVGLPSPIAAPRLGPAANLAYAKSLPTTGPASQTVVAFLDAYAAGKGDLGRYTSPGATISAITPAPYQAVSPLDVRVDVDPANTPKDGTQLHVLATVSLTTQLDQSVTSTYALTLTARATRWEVTSIDPAPLEVTSTSTTTIPTPSPSR